MGDSTFLKSDFTITVPESIRIEQGWDVGQELAYVPTETGVKLVPVPNLGDLLGSLPDADPNNYRDRNDRA